jgi:aryl-phospho-beta-D-glucosidase BglC (GH1 family)
MLDLHLSVPAARATHTRRTSALALAKGVFSRRRLQLVTLACAAGGLWCAIPGMAFAASVSSVEATQGTFSGSNMTTVSDSAASAGSAVRYGWGGSVQLQAQLPADADTLTLSVRGDQCGGAPAYNVSVDGVQVGSGTVTSSTWTSQSYPQFIGAGTHTISVTYTNPGFKVYPACTRALYLDTVAFDASAGITAPANPPIPAGFVHQSGTTLLDGAGQPLKLRGVNLGGWLNWEGWIWGQGTDYVGQTAMLNNLASLVGQPAAQQFQQQVYDNFITGDDFKAISEDGFNVVRVPFNYKLLEDDSQPFVYKQSGWDVLDRLISEAKANNVYVVLDMHTAPCSQLRSFTSDYVAPAYMWTSQQCQDRMVAMWKAIAARYANENTIAGYDLLNESMVSDQQLLGIYQRATAAIRQVDVNHLLIYEGNNLASTFSAFTTPLDPNEMLSFHDYAFENPGKDLTTRMPAYDAAATAINAPQWAGEFGQANYSSIAHYVSTFNQDPKVAGWADWTWKQSPGYAALQTIQQTPASQLLINWINNTSRPQPTLAQAQQGMSDFINAVKFQNTLPDAQLQQTLTAGQ